MFNQSFRMSFPQLITVNVVSKGFLYINSTLQKVMFCNPHIQRLKVERPKSCMDSRGPQGTNPPYRLKGEFSPSLVTAHLQSSEMTPLSFRRKHTLTPSLSHTHTHASTAYYVCFGPLYISRSSLHQESLQIFCFGIVSHLYACLSLLVFDMFTVITVQDLLSNSFLYFTFQDIRK